MESAKPTMENLLEKTECRYELVAVVSKRAKQLVDGAAPLVECGNVKPVIQATSELGASAYGFHHTSQQAEYNR